MKLNITSAQLKSILEAVSSITVARIAIHPQIDAGGFARDVLASILRELREHRVVLSADVAGASLHWDAAAQRIVPAATAGKPMTVEDADKLPTGLYRVFWTEDGGSSLAAIGIDRQGHRWLAPTNWVEPATIGSPWWNTVQFVEKIYP